MKTVLYKVMMILRNIISVAICLREVSVLCYHTVDESDWDLSVSSRVFEEHMLWLKNNNYYYATLNEVVLYIQGRRNLNKKVVAVTFDDGYEDVYHNAFPLLKKYKIPFTVFLVDDFNGSMVRRDSSLSSLTEGQIREMEDSGLASFEYHSKSHKLLSSITVQEIVEEISGGGRFKYFAYPGGHSSKKAFDEIRKYFKAAFSISPGLVHKWDKVFSIKRNVILRDMQLWEFKIRVTKAIDWYVNIVRMVKKI